MNITGFDLMVMVCMAIAVVSMSYTFPALGLTDSSVDENDIPEFEIESDRFDFAGQFPENPGTPSQGSLEVSDGDGDQVTLHDNGTHSVQLSAVNNTSSPNLTPQVYLGKYNDSSSSPQLESVTLEYLGDEAILEAFEYELELTWTSTRNADQSDETAVVDYEIVSQPGDEGWLTRVPIIGGIVSSGEAIANVVGWIGSIIWWGVAVAFETIVNVVGLVFDVATYFIGTFTWMITAYTGIVSGAGSWAAVFVAIPGILLFAELAKVVMVLVSLLPTT
ncbi:hypothetical protein [Natrinema salinisoli]|uniref:hypothetical protein n=1 Tax=Natrinema salinisoli TaxID=2878535 RepID=UPI001CEFE354|nr:hypothetical protein [Natrinema salinisoli]